MISSKAKSHRVVKMLDLLDGADTMLCNAALCNVLTKRTDEHIRGLCMTVRRLRADLAKEAAAKYPDGGIE